MDIRVNSATSLRLRICEIGCIDIDLSELEISNLDPTFQSTEDNVISDDCFEEVLTVSVVYNGLVLPDIWAILEFQQFNSIRYLDQDKLLADFADQHRYLLLTIHEHWRRHSLRELEIADATCVVQAKTVNRCTQIHYQQLFDYAAVFAMEVISKYQVHVLFQHIELGSFSIVVENRWFEDNAIDKISLVDKVEAIRELAAECIEAKRRLCAALQLELTILDSFSLPSGIQGHSNMKAGCQNLAVSTDSNSNNIVRPVFGAAREAP